ncbi:MAG: hypothetical protein E6357_28920 [Clostridiales bacterium]|nr:hypothetical protein [Clostridiales bacterium]
MSDLRPIGEPIMIEGVERHLLFTLNSCDAIQDKFDSSLEEVIDMLMDKRKCLKATKGVLTELLNDEVERLDHDKKEHEFKKYTWQEIGWILKPDNVSEAMFAILRAYGISIPETDEFDSPNAGGGQKE